MYIVLLNYTGPLEEISYTLPDRLEWLERQYSAGHFLVSGRCEPRTGAVIIARPMSRLKLQAILGEDPLRLRGLATYSIVEFRASRTAPHLLDLNEALPEAREDPEAREALPGLDEAVLGR